MTPQTPPPKATGLELQSQCDVEGDSIIMSLPVSERLVAPTSGAETSAAGEP
jgi:hypothetical protein